MYLMLGYMMKGGGRLGMMDGNLEKNPLFQLGVIFHIFVAVLILLILLFTAMLLWEKVQTERQINGRKNISTSERPKSRK